MRRREQPTTINEQPSLFGFIIPRAPFRMGKVISKERMLEGKKLLAQGNIKGAVEILRDARYKLENYERSITTTSPIREPEGSKNLPR